MHRFPEVAETSPELRKKFWENTAARFSTSAKNMGADVKDDFSG
jgi:hypothetical protein